MKNLLSNHIWSVTIGAFLIVSIILGVIVGIWADLLSGAWEDLLSSALITLFSFLVLSSVLLVQSVVSVPERYKAIQTYFAKFNKVLEPGLNFVYPWFNIFSIPIAYNTSEHSIDVFEDANGDFDEMVEFKESAAWVKLSVRLKVIDAKKAYTAVDDVYYEIINIFKKRFRDFAEDKDVFNLKEENKDVDLDALFPVGDRDILDHIKNVWGVKVISIRLEDVIYSEEDRKARQKVYAERNELAVVKLKNEQIVAKAKAEAQRIKTIAKAEKSAQKLEGSGLKEALKRITESNLSPEEASRFLQSMKKWQAVPQVQTGFFSDGSQSSTESGISKQAIAEIIAMANEIGKK